MTIDTNQRITVVTQFLTTDGTANGDLKSVRRKWIQNGKVIENTNVIIWTYYFLILQQFCVLLSAKELKNLYYNTF